MTHHKQIDERSRRMAMKIAERIDADPAREGLEHARQVCSRWRDQNPSPAIEEWHAILQKTWPEIRRLLVEDSEEGCRRRQSSPFCGILTRQERWDFFRPRRAHHEPQPA